MYDIKFSNSKILFCQLDATLSFIFKALSLSESENLLKFILMFSLPTEEIFS